MRLWRRISVSAEPSGAAADPGSGCPERKLLRRQLLSHPPGHRMPRWPPVKRVKLPPFTSTPGEKRVQDSGPPPDEGPRPHQETTSSAPRLWRWPLPRVAQSRPQGDLQQDPPVRSPEDQSPQNPGAITTPPPEGLSLGDRHQTPPHIRSDRWAWLRVHGFLHCRHGHGWFLDRWR